MNKPLFLKIIKFYFFSLIFCTTLLSAAQINIGILTNVSGQVEISNSQDREADFGVDIYAGDIISAANNSTFTLTYYNGCRQEVIKQNSAIKVGENNSSIIKGAFSKIDSFDCEVPEPRLSNSDSHKKAGVTFRGKKDSKAPKMPDFEEKTSTFCTQSKPNKSLKQLRYHASQKALFIALSKFLTKSDKTKLQTHNNPLVINNLLNNYVKESKIIKYYMDSDKICSEVVVTANKEDLINGLQSIIESKKIILLSDKYNHKNGIDFKLWTNRKESPYFRDDEQIFIYFISNKDVYLKLDYFMADESVAHLIPNVLSEYKKIKSGKLYVIGGKNSQLNLVASPPYGYEEIRALVSLEPFDDKIQSKESVESSTVYEKLIESYISNSKSRNKLVSASFELISTP